MRLFFLMLFSAADYTHALTHDKSWTEKSKHPTDFFHHPKPFLCYDTVAAAVRSLSLRGAGWMWLADIQALFSSAVELSRSEWPPLWCRLCGPGQDTGLQDCENCFTPRLPPFYLLLVCRCIVCAKNTIDPFSGQFLLLEMRQWVAVVCFDGVSWCFSAFIRSATRTHVVAASNNIISANDVWETCDFTFLTELNRTPSRQQGSGHVGKVMPKYRMRGGREWDKNSNSCHQ